MSIFTNYGNADAVIIKLFKYLKIDVDSKKVIDELGKHPHYPSMLALVDILNTFNISNYAYVANAEDIYELPTPFIIFTNVNGGDFAVVKKIKDNKLYLSNEQWNNYVVTQNEFKEIYNSVVLTVEHSKRENSLQYSKFNRPLIKHLVLLAAICGIILSEIFFNTSFPDRLTWRSLSLVLIKSAGLFTSILLLIQSIDEKNPFINKICRQGTNSDCSSILSSDAAKVFDGLSWSEVGFFYFAGTWLILVFGNPTATTTNILAILNFVSLPYTVYSIYYQSHVAKRWCILCCTIQALLWLEFIPLIGVFKLPIVMPTTSELNTLIINLALPIIIWQLLKPFCLKIGQFTPMKNQLTKLKYDPDTFNSLLNKQPRFELPDKNWSIVLGNMQPNNIITIVSNPYCRTCNKVHHSLDELLASKDDLQARIIFATNDDKNNPQTPIVRHLMALNESPDDTVIKQALNAWYNQKQKNFDLWKSSFPATITDDVQKKLENQNAWCRVVGVTSTPFVLLNGYFLPDTYQLDDIKYLLDCIEHTTPSKEEIHAL